MTGYSRLTSALMLAAFVSTGCSSERELPVSGGDKPISIATKGSLSNPLKIVKGPGKQIARRTSRVRP